ncbi:MAG: ferritin family protein [Thermodesulfobacteriota bacterium]
MSPMVKYACEHCGAEADMILEGFESVEDVIKKKKGMICKNCGKEIETLTMAKKAFACDHCGAEADMTLEGFEKVEDVVKRHKKLTCHHCGKDISWTVREDLRAIEIAMKAEKEASQYYSKAAKMTKNPKGKDMFQQLSEFEMSHYKRLKELSQSVQEKGEWILYSGTSLKEKSIPLKIDKPKGKEQLTDMDALKIAVKEEKKAQASYRSMAELTKDPRGRDMYKRLANEEALHEKVLNDQYYSLHNTGVWSWGD